MSTFELLASKFVKYAFIIPVLVFAAVRIVQRIKMADPSSQTTSDVRLGCHWTHWIVVAALAGLFTYGLVLGTTSTSVDEAGMIYGTTPYSLYSANAIVSGFLGGLVFMVLNHFVYRIRPAAEQ